MLDGLSEVRLAKRLATRDLYAAGFQSFEFGAYEEAALTFRKVAKLDPDDRAARATMPRRGSFQKVRPAWKIRCLNQNPVRIKLVPSLATRTHR